MKKNNQGFMLVETLIMSLVIIGVLIFMFIQFQNINRSYDRSFDYNTVTGLYLTNEIREFLVLNDYLDEFTETALNSNNKYVTIYDSDNNGVYSCNSMIDNDDCDKLMDQANVEDAIIIYFENDDDLKGQRREGISEKMNDFINYTKKEENSYRLFVAFKNGTFASLKLGGIQNEE